MKDRNSQITILQDGKKTGATPLRRRTSHHHILPSKDNRSEETTAEFWEHYFDEQKESNGGVILFLSVLSGPFIYFLCKTIRILRTDVGTRLNQLSRPEQAVRPAGLSNHIIIFNFPRR